MYILIYEQFTSMEVKTYGYYMSTVDYRKQTSQLAT